MQRQNTRRPDYVSSALIGIFFFVLVALFIILVIRPETIAGQALNLAFWVMVLVLVMGMLLELHSRRPLSLLYICAGISFVLATAAACIAASVWPLEAVVVLHVGTFVGAFTVLFAVLFAATRTWRVVRSFS